jgi:hypothetical protein
MSGIARETASRHHAATVTAAGTIALSSERIRLADLLSESDGPEALMASGPSQYLGEIRDTGYRAVWIGSTTMGSVAHVTCSIPQRRP